MGYAAAALAEPRKCSDARQPLAQTRPTLLRRHFQQALPALYRRTIAAANALANIVSPVLLSSHYGAGCNALSLLSDSKNEMRRSDGMTAALPAAVQADVHSHVVSVVNRHASLHL